MCTRRYWVFVHQRLHYQTLQNKWRFGLMRTHFVIASVACNPVAVATAVRRRVFSLIEIATSLDGLGISGRSSQ